MKFHSSPELLSAAGFAEIMDANPVPCFVIDAQHRVIHWNKGCEQVLGISASTMIGTSNQWQAFYSASRATLADLIVDEQIDSFADSLYKNKTLRRSAVIPGAFEAEDFFPQLGDEGRRLFFTAAPVRDASGKIIGAVETLQDVTIQRQAELLLKQSNAQLEQLVAARTAELAETNHQLTLSLHKAEEANRIKSAFLATVSHELKTPLHGIIGIAELIRMEQISDSTLSYAKIIQENGESLFRLIDNMLSLTEIEADEAALSLATYSTREVLESVATDFTRDAEAKGISLRSEHAESIPETILTDAAVLTKVIAALIDNAIKFTDVGGVHFSVSEEASDLVIGVTDTGPGIPAELQAAVFEKFRQLENFETRQHDGLGLGLALAKARAELLGGTLTLENPLDQRGARFVLRIPKQRTPA
jgi:hypothetical protein